MGGNKSGKPMLYVNLKKALYGTLQAALGFWRILSDIPIEWGFKLNENDQCVANRTINGNSVPSNGMSQPKIITCG